MFDISTLRASYTDKGTDVIEFSSVDGKTYTMPAPQFWPDAVFLAAEANDMVGMGRSLLGDQYPDFIAGGGRSADLNLVFEAYASGQGVSRGESSLS